ncbi:MAG TPA: hypothetical protein VHV78_12880 [Gemmatimonadaceae bacterium]|jgi:hypothetical protein|nr:hypothetical protein [Gemmatimonadaceae bacterium]
MIKRTAKPALARIEILQGALDQRHRRAVRAARTDRHRGGMTIFWRDKESRIAT